MPAMTTLTINDGQATPVAHSFEPLTTTGYKAVWVNRASGLPNAYERLEYEVVEPRSATGAYRVIGSLTRPILGTVNGVQVVVKTNKSNFDINFAQSSLPAERKDDVTLLANFFGNAAVKSAIEKIEPFY